MGSGQPNGTVVAGWRGEPAAGSRSPVAGPLGNVAGQHGQRELRYSPQGAVSTTV